MRASRSLLLWAMLAPAFLLPGRAAAQPEPLNLAGEATGQPGQVVLEWTAPEDSTLSGYNIYWSTSSGVPQSGNENVSVSASTTSYTTGPSQIADGQPMTYWVSTLDSGGESAPAGPVFATSGVPAPAGLTATALGVSQVALTWGQVPYTPNNESLSDYQIFYSTQSSDPFAPGLTSTGASLALSGTVLSAFPDGTPFQPGVLTWFWIAGAVGQGPGAFSKGAPAMPFTVPAAPSLAATVLSFGQGIALSVSPGAEPTPSVPLGVFTVFETLNSVSTTVAAMNPLTPTVTLSAGALPCGVGVTLQARATDIEGNSGTASQDLWLEAPCAPTVLANPPTALSSGNLNLAWNAPAGGAAGYAIFSATGPAWGMNPLPTTVTSFTTGLSYSTPASPGQSLWYRVYAVDERGVTSAASNEVGVLGPPAPAGAIPSTDQVYLSWTAPAAASSVGLEDSVVYYSSASGFVFGVSQGAQSLTAPASAMGLTVTGLQDFTPYAFALASQGGSPSPISGTLSSSLTMTTGLQGPQLGALSTSPSPGPSVVFRADPPPTGQGSTLLAQWSDRSYSPLASTVYTLYEATDATATPQTYNSITPVASASGSAGFVSFTAGAPGPAWYFLSVSDSSGTDGVGPAGDGGADTTNARTQASAYFAPNLAPSTLTLSAPSTNGRVLLQWNPVPFADTYTVYRATQDMTTVGASGVTYSALATSATPAVFSPLGTVPGTTETGQSGGPLTSTALAFTDTAPVENARNAYEVVPSAQLSGGGLVFGAASNAVTTTPKVLPSDPGQYQAPGLGASAYAAGYFVTATALANSRGVFLEWAPSGDGSYPVSCYNVYRGFSPLSLSLVATTTWYAYAPTTVTVHGVTFVPPMPHYFDAAAPQPWSDLYYGVSATDVSGNSSPDIVTATVGAALPWPAPLASSVVNGNSFCSGCATSYGRGQVNLDWAPGAYIPAEGSGYVTISAGTFPFDYWKIQRVSAAGAPPLTLGAGPVFGQYLNVTAPANSPGNLTTDAATTAADISPTGGTPLYLISAVDVAGNVGVPLGLSITVPTSLTNQVPVAVAGLTASATVFSALAGTATADILGETLAWVPSPASDAVTGYEVTRYDSANPSGVSVSVGTYPSFTDLLGANDPAGEAVTYTVAAWNSRGMGPQGAALTVPLAPPAPAWVSFTADIPAGVSQSPAVGLVWQDALGLQSPTTFGNGDYTGSYSVYRSDDPSAPLAGCAGLTVSTCTDLSPLAGSKASYTVLSVATNNAGSGGNSVDSLTSPARTLTLNANAPAPPASLSAFAGASGVSLVWTAALTGTASSSPGPYEYWIYRSSYAWPAAPDYGSYLARVTTNSFADTGTKFTADLSASAQAEPYYAVAAASPFAVGSALTVTAALAPPSSLTAVAGGVGAGYVSATVTLLWQPSVSGSLVTGYDIWRASESATGPVGNTYLTTTAAGSGVPGYTYGYTDASVTAAGLTNTVLVYSVMAQGVSPGTCAAVTITAYDLPHAPVAVQGNGLPAGVDLSWRPAPPSQGVTGYAVDWTVLGGGPSGVTQVAASPQTWSLNGLVPGQSVAATVFALNSAGASLSGTSTIVGVNDEGPALIPSSFTIQSGLPETAGSPGVFLSVSAPAAAELVIYRSPPPGASQADWAPLRLTDAAGGVASPYYLTTLAGTSTSMTDTAVSPLDRYSYAVTAVNADGVPGGESVALASSPTSVAAYLPWAAPAMAATAGNARVDLSWAPPSPPGGPGSYYPLAAYRLYRQETAPALSDTAIAPAAADPGFPKTFYLSSLTQDAYTDTQVSDGLPYVYDMTSVDSQGNESPLPSFPAYAQPINGAAADYLEPVAPLPAPASLSATVGGYPNLVTLDWVSTQSDTSAGATYNIYRRLEYSSTTCTSAPTYGPPLADGFHVGPSPYSSYGDVTLAANVFVDGSPGEPDPPQNRVPVCYAVSAVDAAGEGPKSQEVCVTPYNPLAPVNDAWSASIFNTTQVRLQWYDVPAAGNGANGGYATLGYEVERSSNDGNTFTQIAFVNETPGATSSTQQIYTDTNLDADGVAVKGVSYYYNIYPVDVSNNAGTGYGIKTVDIPSGTNSLYVYRNSFDPVRGGFVPIQCGLQQPGTYWIKIFTLNGEYVNTIIPPTHEDGQPSNPYLSPQVDWFGNNSRGETVASGVYLIHLQGPGYISDARVAVIK
ncbi:MAG TPA: hypothetical protein VK914_08410 [bacterium]|jgi:hypothetical protein|nr:hypothetical protein [bacterium]